MERVLPIPAKGDAHGSCVAWSRRDRVAVGCTDGSVYVWDRISDEPARKLDAHEDAVNVIAWSSDGSRLATGGSYADPTSKLWTAEGELLRVFSGNSGSVHGIAWKRPTNDADLVTCTREGVIWSFSPDSSGPRSTLRPEDGALWCLAVSPVSGLIACGGSKGRVVLARSEEMRSVPVGLEGEWVRTVSWSPGSEAFVAGSDARTIAFDVGTSNVLWALPTPARHVAWSPNGYPILSCTDGVLTILASDDGSVLSQTPIDGLGAACWAPDGARILLCTTHAGASECRILWVSWR